MKQLEFKTPQERNLWWELESKLRIHNSFKVINKYYPNKMDDWENDKLILKTQYLNMIEELNKQRTENKENILTSDKKNIWFKIKKFKW